MAFVLEAERNLEKIEALSPNLGPGKYLGPHDYKISPSYAPFSSLVERSKEKKNQKQFETPGVGQYQISKPIGYQESETTQASENSQFGFKQNHFGSSSFKSKQERFHSQDNQIPGPGMYSQDFPKIMGKSYTSKSPEKNGKQNLQMIEGIRTINQSRKIASIPNKIIKIYHDPKKSEIVDIEKMLEQQQNQEEGVGPGKYNIKDQFLENKEKKGAQWSKSGEKKFDQVPHKANTDPHMGPGLYNVVKTSPKYKNNPSSTFVSDTVRSIYDKLYYNTQNELKAQIRKETNYKTSDKPAPGQYPVEHIKKAINLKYKPLIHQYFDSTQERFPEKQKEFNISPGQYHQNKAFGSEKTNQSEIFQEIQPIQVGFLSTQPKETKLKQNTTDLPGVGTYESQSGLTIKEKLIKKYHQGYKGKFGTEEKRFKQFNAKTEQNSLIGPGYYCQFTTESEKKPCDTSIFKSGTKRNCFQNETEQSPDKSYDIVVDTIGYRQEKQKLFIENLRKIEVIRPGFDSSNNRFPHYSKHQRAFSTNHDIVRNNTNENLERMNFINEFDKFNTSFEKKRKNKFSPENYKKTQGPAPFNINSKKADFIQDNKTPGPGRYTKDIQWSKKSYNIKYQGQQQNQNE